MSDKISQNLKIYRKLRTREHIIEDMSINHIQRHVLLCGFSLEKFDSDYGYDLFLFTYSCLGEIESGSIKIQMKASDHIRINKKKDCIFFDVSTRDLRLWLTEYDPVILVIYDAASVKAYWIDIQSYFKTIKLTRTHKKQKTYRVYISKKSRVNSRTLKQLAKLKNDRYDIINPFT
ncbi:DUF4365 domain-containing protein [Chitinophaga sp. SYP-B3965]|uniref:DUF4365 domain-containing protein n=1 Tax=Chitinophaga sp. SYP-B3965 TaxID=2663120 RepID=UPI0012996B44|nr:DUF4365 domain-containing protein [Chitinophaga sp. SYP-B3965]MRG45352.1 DUF4365 domain-containing protein [Chitinophaga sp. SYP-B3965]